VWEKFDVKKSGSLDVDSFERMIKFYWVELNESMFWKLVVLLDVNQKKELSYYYIVRIYNIESLDDPKRSSVMTSGS